MHFPPAALGGEIGQTNKTFLELVWGKEGRNLGW